jgi:hypothetical protein
MKKTFVVEINWVDVDRDPPLCYARYYRATVEQLKQIYNMRPDDASLFIEKNCKLAKISEDADVGFVASMICYDKDWKKEWKDVQKDIDDAVGGK